MRADLAKQLQEARIRMASELSKVGKPHPLGHAFIWGDLPVKLKNGKIRYHKTCITSVCTDDLRGCVALAEQLGALNVFYNLD